MSGLIFISCFQYSLLFSDVCKSNHIFMPLCANVSDLMQFLIKFYLKSNFYSKFRKVVPSACTA